MANGVFKFPAPNPPVVDLESKVKKNLEQIKLENARLESRVEEYINEIFSLLAKNKLNEAVQMSAIVSSLSGWMTSQRLKELINGLQRQE